MYSQDLNSFLIKLKKCVSFNDYFDAMKNTYFSSIDFNPYIQFQRDKYRRNLIIKTDEFELILICWMKGQKSAIHDHGNSECIMLCLHGELNENVYILSRDEKIELLSKDNLVRISSSTMTQLDLSHINNELGIHEVSNISSDYAVSLHLYIPCMDTFISYETN